MNRIDDIFGRLRTRGEPAFIPFLTAGDPGLSATADLIAEFQRRGADIIELGFPFSDPVADGPVIQASYTRVLERGQRVREVFDMVRALRERCEIGIVAMVSYSILFRYGPERFIADAADAGLDGATVPDLPIEESLPLLARAEESNFHVVGFMAPTTTEKRLHLVGQHAHGFIYYICVRGITGVRDRLPDDVAANVARIRQITNKPVAIGFGISTPEMAREAARVADGVISGSAIIRLIDKHRDAEAETLVKIVGDFVESLARGAKGH